MKLALIAALLFTTPVLASPRDDFVACVVGQAAVALQNKEPKESALEIAYDMCPVPEGIGSGEGIADYINLMVERMAAE
jgi:hypothetical protein